MRIFWGYFVCVLLGTALAAPVAYFLLDGLISYPFHRYVNRCLMVNALLFIVVFSRQFQFRSIRDMGFTWETDSWQQLCSGVFLGASTMFAVVLIEWFLGGRHGGGDYGFWHVTSIVSRALLIAVLVAPAEEFLFRWTFQRVILQPLREWHGILLLSLIFALVHFFKVPPDFRPDPVQWYSGAQAVILMFEPLLRLETYGPKMLSLWFAGITLSWLVVRTGTLWAAVALHATWIFIREITVKLSLIPPGSDPFWCAADVTSGGVAMVSLALITIGVWFYYPRYTRT